MVEGRDRGATLMADPTGAIMPPEAADGPDAVLWPCSDDQRQLELPADDN